MAWNDLSMAEKARIIKMGVDSGLTHLNHIRDAYNSFSEGGYTQWKKELLEWNPDLEEDINSDNPSYDYEGFYYDNPQYAYDLLKEKSGTHFTDKFKRPNHPTFSDESIYSSPKTPGGHWRQAEDKWFYQPSEYTGTPERIKETRDYLMNTGEGYSVGNDVYFPTTAFDPDKTYKFDQTPVITTNGNYVEDINPSSYKYGGRINKYDGYNFFSGGGGLNHPEGLVSLSATAPIYEDEESGEIYYVTQADGRYRMKTISSLEEGLSIYNQEKEASEQRMAERKAQSDREYAEIQKRAAEYEKQEAVRQAERKEAQRLHREELDRKGRTATENTNKWLTSTPEQIAKREARLRKIDHEIGLVQGAMDQSAYVDTNLPEKVMTAYNNQEAQKHEVSESEKMTHRLMNLMSPTQLIRGIYDATQGENFAESMEGNNGIVPDVVVQDDPDRAFMTNFLGDIGIYSGADMLYDATLGRYLQKRGLLKDINTSIERAEFPSVAEDYADPTYNRFRMGDVEINDPNLNYRQGGAGMVDDFLEEGKVSAKSEKAASAEFDVPGIGSFSLKKSFDTPMFKQGGLWYDNHLIEYPRETTPRYSDLLTTREQLQFANQRARPVNTDKGGRRIPFSEDQLGFGNTTPYVWEDGYGFRKVPIEPESVTSWKEVMDVINTKR